jgi:hypothetical protein
MTSYPIEERTVVALGTAAALAQAYLDLHQPGAEWQPELVI